MDRVQIRASILWGLTAAAVVAAVAWILILATQALVLIYISMLLAGGLSVPVGYLEGRRILSLGGRLPRWAALLILYFAILSVMAGVVYAIVPTLVNQAQNFVSELPEYLEMARNRLTATGLLQGDGRQGTGDEDGGSLAEVAKEAPASGIITGALTGIWKLLGGIFGLVTILVLTFYLILESEMLFKGVLNLFPKENRPLVGQISRQVRDKISAWIIGQLLLSAIVGIITALVLAILGVPYFFVLGLIAAIGEVIPYLGPFLASIPAILTAATVSYNLAIGVAAFYVALQLLENNLLVPKIFGHEVQLSAAVVIMVIVIGGSIYGILGALLAVPTAAILQVLFQELGRQ